MPPSVVKALKSLCGDILADAHAGPISMKEFGNPLFSKLLSKEFKSLKSLGIIPETANMFPWSGPVWDDLSDEEKMESARDMEVYAAMIEYMDEQISRIFNWLEENNKMDNTIIVFF